MFRTKITAPKFTRRREVRRELPHYAEIGASVRTGIDTPDGDTMNDDCARNSCLGENAAKQIPIIAQTVRDECIGTSNVVLASGSG